MKNIKKKIEDVMLNKIFVPTYKATAGKAECEINLYSILSDTMIQVSISATNSSIRRGEYKYRKSAV